MKKISLERVINGYLKIAEDSYLTYESGKIVEEDGDAKNSEDLRGFLNTHTDTFFAEDIDILDGEEHTLKQLREVIEEEVSEKVMDHFKKFFLKHKKVAFEDLEEEIARVKGLVVSHYESMPEILENSLTKQIESFNSKLKIV